MICRHCKKAKISRPRNLCWCCYYRPGIKDLYPSTSKHARRGVGNFAGKAATPSEPTYARPGSAEKVAILAERASKHQSLWHPQDASINEERIYDMERLLVA